MERQRIILILILFLGIIGDTRGGDNEKYSSFRSDTVLFLDIPERSENAAGGSEFAERITGYDLEKREIAIAEEILAGNIPSFSRKLRKLVINKSIGSKEYELILYAACDYMAIGSDSDYFYIPMTPSTAGYLADRLDCSLPTKKIVDVIYREAEIKLYPQPIPPSDKMTTVPCFTRHSDSVKQQILHFGHDHSGLNIFAGHKKDIIISNKIYSNDRTFDRVVIYGWHRSVNDPIQPVYNGHIAAYADYSHGIRFLFNKVFLNGDSTGLRDILQDNQLWPLLSSEGVIGKPYYPESGFFSSIHSSQERNSGKIQLFQNYPNPFFSLTTIDYFIEEPSFVDLAVYSLTGRKIKTLVNGIRKQGKYSVMFRGSDLANGIYFYRLTANAFQKSMKMLIVR